MVCGETPQIKAFSKYYFGDAFLSMYNGIKHYVKMESKLYIINY
jgi:hypothetical protein